MGGLCGRSHSSCPLHFAAVEGSTAFGCGGTVDTGDEAVTSTEGIFLAFLAGLALALASPPFSACPFVEGFFLLTVVSLDCW